jgi:hypothetical protein
VRALIVMEFEPPLVNYSRLAKAALRQSANETLPPAPSRPDERE